jgi:hypothetical protein
MEFWVQRTLFDVPRRPSHQPERRGRIREVRDGESGSQRIDHSRVTRDPAVAVSHGEGVRLASDLRVGLARALDSLAPEERQRIRAMLSRTDSSAA